MKHKNTKREEEIVTEVLNKIGSPKDCLLYDILKVKDEELLTNNKK